MATTRRAGLIVSCSLTCASVLVFLVAPPCKGIDPRKYYFLTLCGSALCSCALQTCNVALILLHLAQRAPSRYKRTLGDVRGEPLILPYKAMHIGVNKGRQTYGLRDQNCIVNSFWATASRGMRYGVELDS